MQTTVKDLIEKLNKIKDEYGDNLIVDVCSECVHYGSDFTVDVEENSFKHIYDCDNIVIIGINS